MTRFSSGTMPAPPGGAAGASVRASLMLPPWRLVEEDLPLQVELVVTGVAELDAAVEELQVGVVAIRPEGQPRRVAGLAGRRAGEPSTLEAEDGAHQEG